MYYAALSLKFDEGIDEVACSLINIPIDISYGDISYTRIFQPKYLYMGLVRTEAFTGHKVPVNHFTIAALHRYFGRNGCYGIGELYLQIISIATAVDIGLGLARDIDVYQIRITVAIEVSSYRGDSKACVARALAAS